MKKVILITLLLAGCSIPPQQASIIGEKNGKPVWTISGLTLYTSDKPPREAALSYVTEAMAGACPKGVVLQKDFVAVLSPNWAGVNHLQWTGPIQCK